MSQRFGPSYLHQRDPRSALFAGYTGDQNRRPASSNSGGYGYPGANGGGGAGGPAPSNPYANSTYNGSASSLGPDSIGRGNSGFRPATPNKKGQYSDAVLNELESQNDAQVAGILGKVRVLKDMTSAIGDEIRDSSALAEKMNDSFEQTRVRLRGTMNRMLIMAQRTGIPWKVWLLFFAAVILIFMYVWLF